MPLQQGKETWIMVVEPCIWEASTWYAVYVFLIKPLNNMKTSYKGLEDEIFMFWYKQTSVATIMTQCGYEHP